MGSSVSGNVPTAIAVALLTAIAVAVLTFAGVPLRRGVLVAMGRAALQLSVLALILRGVIAAPLAAAAVLLVMLGTAGWTAGRRTSVLAGSLPAALLACAAGTAPVLVVIFAVGALPFQARYVIAVSGIVIGGTMTACTLAGRRYVAGMIDRRDQVEGWLALGARPRRAVRDVARTAIREALLPGIDQTRTTGLVTLPGAFVGALVGGASPAGAARFQIIVLSGLLAAGSVAAATLLYRLGDPQTLPVDPVEPDRPRRRYARPPWQMWRTRQTRRNGTADGTSRPDRAS